ncbi:MAG: glycosyltransferase family 2 protein [Mycobacteriales bacterium]|nr:glycosyltransferase family 2 protein [Mycobacteriales bacterium]
MHALAPVGVVVVAYRSAEYLPACLAPLPRDELAGVVVVDNGSPDRSAAVARLLGAEVLEQGNVGFGAGCNTGWRHLAGRCEWVLLLNPDAVIDAKALRALLAYASARPRLGLVAPRLTANARPSWSSGRLPTLATELRPLLPAPVGRLLPARRTPVDEVRDGPVGYVEGAVMLARVAALDAVGGFDETYFLAYEEIDLAHRMALAGWTVELCATAVAEHVGGASRAQDDFAGVDHPTRSLLHYLATWRGPRAARVWVLAARLSWRLRARTGRMADGELRLRLQGLATPLVPGEGGSRFRARGRRAPR